VRVSSRVVALLGWERVERLDAVLADRSLAVEAVDMPIGIPERGPREADLLARAALRPHGARVFPAPVRAALAHPDDYRAACAASVAAQGRALSRQAWHLVPKVLEADEAAADPRLVEVHPELSFAEMAGAPLAASKRTPEGRAGRLLLLAEHVRGFDPSAAPPGDDALDALAAAWTAARIARDAARSLPADPPRDPRGRPMRIVV